MWLLCNISNWVIQLAIQIKYWNNDTCQCECKTHRTCKKCYSWNPSTCICENGKCLQSIADTSVSVCNEIIHVMDIVSTNLENTIPTNVSRNFNGKNVRCKMDYYILHTVLYWWWYYYS